MSKPPGDVIVAIGAGSIGQAIARRKQNEALALTPADELLSLSFLQADQVKDSLYAYQLSKRANSLRVMAEAVRWGKRGARFYTISPGIIITPLAKDELSGQRGAGYRRMIELSAAGRAGTPDEVASVDETPRGFRCPAHAQGPDGHARRDSEGVVMELAAGEHRRSPGGRVDVKPSAKSRRALA